VDVLIDTPRQDAEKGRVSDSLVENKIQNQATPHDQTSLKKEELPQFHTPQNPTPQHPAASFPFFPRKTAALPFPVMFPAMPQPIATPLAMPPPHFSSSKISIPTAVPLFPSTVQMQKSTQNPGNAVDDRKRKREERLAKNRESANKSRIRRKMTLEALKEELQRTTAELIASRAENASLKEQNSYLRSLISPVSSVAACGTDNPSQQTLVGHAEMNQQNVNASQPACSNIDSSNDISCSTTSTSNVASRMTGTLMFAVVLSCSFLSNPFDLGIGQEAGHASASGRVLLSTDTQLETPQFSFFPSISSTVAMPHIHISPTVPLFSQRILENVVVNMLTLTCSIVMFFFGIVVYRRCYLGSAVLPVFNSDKPKVN